MGIGLDLQRAYDDGYKKGWEEAEAYALHCGDETSITNADRIRAMTDEELADIFRHLCCPYSLGGNPECTEKKVGRGCKGCWLDWLREECQ